MNVMPHSNDLKANTQVFRDVTPCPWVSPDPVPSNSGSSTPKIWMAWPWGRRNPCHILEDLSLLQHRRNNLKSYHTAYIKKWALSIHQSHNTSLLQISVLHMGVRLYKRLPLKIKKLDNFNQFRKEVKLTLLNNLFYTLEEFSQASVDTPLVVIYIYI